MQALIGLVVIVGFNAMLGGDLSAYLGLLVTHGFTQGPGQALAFGSIWENELGITHAINFGLIYASVGFIVAFGVGVPVARWAIRQGLNANKNARIEMSLSQVSLRRKRSSELAPRLPTLRMWILWVFTSRFLPSRIF